ncbi:MAG: CHAT domain-containing protein [Planctomycetes bacterium]|nr:CHAT domain-containing protein [Planctomycetota bacterium]
MLDHAEKLWCAGHLGKAREGIAQAERACESLGENHWVRWYGKLDADMLQAQQAWTPQQRAAFAAHGVDHLFNATPRLLAVATGSLEPNDAAEEVNAICALLRETFTPEYHLLVESYRCYFQARIAFRAGEFQDGRRLCEQAWRAFDQLFPFAHPLKVEYRNAAVLALLGMRLTAENFSDDDRAALTRYLGESLEILRENMPVNSDTAGWWAATFRLASLWMLIERNYGPAEAFLYGAFSLSEGYPWRVRLYLDLARLYNWLGDGAKALAVLDELERELGASPKEQPTAADLLVQRGCAYLRLGKMRAACECFQRVAAAREGRTPEQCAQTRYLYGAALVANGEYEQAAQQLRLAAQLTPQPGTRAVCELGVVAADAYDAAKRARRVELRKLIEEVNAVEGLDAQGQCRKQMLLAYIHLFLGDVQDNQDAMVALERAADQYEKARCEGALGAFELASWHENESPYLFEERLYRLDVPRGDVTPLSSYDYLHFAVHGEAHPESPDGCYLELTLPAEPSWLTQSLAQPRFNDGRLMFREILGLHLNTRLVVLSACDTGLGRELESEGCLGLPHAFFDAGACAVIMTMWKVEDLSAAMLMDRFYVNLKTMPCPEALQAAKRHLRCETTWEDVRDWCRRHGRPDLADGYPRSNLPAYQHSKYWAGYILCGPHD